MQCWPCFKCLLPVCAHEPMFAFKCATRGVVWCPSEDHDCHGASVVIALLPESIWVPKALNCSVFRVWNNVVCTQLWVQFIMRNENILKIKETFFFVFTVHCVSLTPTLNLTVHFINSPFFCFCMHADLTLDYPALFSNTSKWSFWEEMCISPISWKCVIGALQNYAITSAEVWVFLTS